MAMPPCVHKIKRGVVFCDDQSSLVTLLPRQADEPIVEKLQIGLGHGADYHHAITCHCLQAKPETLISSFRETQLI
jgi:hypothetical protein